MQIICFEDDRVEQLRPMIHARPAYAISCASFRLIDWLRSAEGTVSGQVRSYLEELQRLDFGLEPTSDFQHSNGVLLVNARLAPTVKIESAIKQMAAESRSVAVVDQQDGALLMARIAAAEIHVRRPESFEQLLELAADLTTTADIALDVFRWPHDVIATHMSAINDALEWRIAHEDHRQIADGVFVMSDESIGDHIAIDVSQGPILLDQDVKIGPFTYLSGPIHAGAGTRVAEHAAIKDGVALGHTVKLGGEVESSIIEPFTNKQHHGFLGHSYLGSWINLGAGSCNSDLKNTYGKINVQYGGQKVATNMQFLGCFIGDYSKTAINTSIFTGKSIGVCSMLYGFVTSDVPSFVNFGRTFGQTTLLPTDVMITTQQRMFARRNVTQRDCDKQLILDLFQRSMAERETADFEIY